MHEDFMMLPEAMQPIGMFILWNFTRVNPATVHKHTAEGDTSSAGVVHIHASVVGEVTDVFTHTHGTNGIAMIADDSE